ncbi:MAG TPA: archease [Candidatus Latescibacteria bacterium]|nr:archease [Candidatus Latescibacterota bacterium]
MVRYELLEGITADVGIRAFGRTLEELFANVGYALFDLLLENLEDVRPEVEVEVEVEAEGWEDLLMCWLRELLYLYEVRREVLCEFKVKEIDEGHISALCKGEELDPERHIPGMEIKAVTYHNLSVLRMPEGWKAEVVFDV